LPNIVWYISKTAYILARFFLGQNAVTTGIQIAAWKEITVSSQRVVPVTPPTPNGNIGGKFLKF